MFEQVVKEFIRLYGAKEAIILTKLCKRMLMGKREFTKPEMESLFPYFTEKQIRTGIDKLVSERALVIVAKGKEGKFETTNYYDVSQKVTSCYLKQQELSLNKSTSKRADKTA